MMTRRSPCESDRAAADGSTDYDSKGKKSGSMIQDFLNQCSPMTRTKLLLAVPILLGLLALRSFTPIVGSSSFLARKGPELVWVLAYPNSGTTYTLALMEQVTNYSMATNYMGDVLQPVPDVPVYDNQPDGPYWRGPSIKPLPDTNVLVKTHCAGYKEEPHEVYDLSLSTFIKKCARTTIYGDKTKALEGRKNRLQRDGYYNPKSVKKALHIIRSPFDNLVARFNNRLFKWNRKGNFPYEKNREGFREFCKMRDENFEEKYKKVKLSEKARKIAQRTICYDNTIAYVLWHNHAFEARKKLGLNTLQLRYEDFESKFDPTLKDLLTFLDLPEKNDPVPFHAGHHYDDYFTEEERGDIKALMRELASEETWDAIQGYFDSE